MDVTEEVAAERTGTKSSKLDALNNNTCEHAETSSISAKLSVEEQNHRRDRRLQVNGGSIDGRTEPPRQSSVECVEEMSRDVDGASDQRETEIIALEKGVFGLGFCIEGGRDCPTGRAPVTVKRIFRGGTFKKVKERIAVNGYSHLTATGRHLPYGITQCYLLPDTSERAPP